MSRSKSSTDKTVQADSKAETSKVCEPASAYKRAASPLTLLGELITVGNRLPYDDNVAALQEVYTHPHGSLFAGDSVEWLASLESGSVDLVFADPPYNIKKADWDSFDSQEQYIAWSMRWIEEAARVLKPTGTLYVCGFSEVLADLKHPASKLFAGCRWIVWHYKNKANLGNDWGRSHESILHLRKSKRFTFNVDDVRIPYGAHTLKYPVHPQAVTSQYGNGEKNHVWVPHEKGAKCKDVIEIPTTCNGMGEKTPHPTQKPEELLGNSYSLHLIPGIWLLIHFPAQGQLLLYQSNLDAAGWAVIYRMNTVHGP